MAEEAALDAQRLLAAEDRGWARLSADGEAVIDRASVMQVSAVARINVAADPYQAWRQPACRLPRHPVRVRAQLRRRAGHQRRRPGVQGRPRERGDLHQSPAGAERERAFNTDGNVFLALPTDPRSGAGAGADHPVPAFLEPREEMAVDELAARRLISWPALLDACRWARTLEELAEELWMDEATAECRMRHLHMSENAKLMEVWADDARAHGH